MLGLFHIPLSEYEALGKAFNEGGTPFRRLIYSFLASSAYCFFHVGAIKLNAKTFTNYEVLGVDCSWIVHEYSVVAVGIAVMLVLFLNLFISKGSLSSEFFEYFFYGSIGTLCFSLVLWAVLMVNYLFSVEVRTEQVIVDNIERITEGNSKYIKYRFSVDGMEKYYQENEKDDFKVPSNGLISLEISKGCFGWEVISDVE